MFRRLLLAASFLASPLVALHPSPAAAQLVIGISVGIAPPPLPYYAQSPMPKL